MPQPGFDAITVPDELVALIDQHLASDKLYRSRAEIVKAAVLEWLKNHGKAVSVRRHR
jgi:Arc/MetJ-type ribon-helix-helix transcriptional regulator